MNTTVTATGMEVKATTSANLVISNSAAASYDVSATASYTGTNTLTPCSTSVSTANVLSAGKFFYVSNGDTVIYDTGAAQSTTTFAAASVTADASNTYVATHTFNIKVDGASSDKFTNVYVSELTVKDGGATDLWVSACYIDGTAAKALSQSLRVAYVAGSTVVICAPVSGATTTYTVGTNPDGTVAAGTSVTAVDTSATGTTTLAKGANNTLQTGDVSDTGLVVNCYVFFEGEDEDHTTVNLNAPGIEDLAIVSKFQCTKVSASSN